MTLPHPVTFYRRFEIICLSHVCRFGMSKKKFRPLNLRTVPSVKMVGNPVTWRFVTEEWIHQPHRCEDLKIPREKYFSHKQCDRDEEKAMLTPLLLYLLTYLLTQWSRALLEKLVGLQLVKKFPAFYGTRRFITGFQNAGPLSLSWASSIHPTSWRSILIQECW